MWSAHKSSFLLILPVTFPLLQCGYFPRAAVHEQLQYGSSDVTDQTFPVMWIIWIETYLQSTMLKRKKKGKWKKKIEILIFIWMGQPDLVESSDGRENLMINIAENMKAWGMNSKLWEAEYRVEKKAVGDTWASWTQHSPKKQLLLKWSPVSRRNWQIFEEVSVTNSFP